MRKRPSARLIIVDRLNRLLLFRFRHKTGALAGRDYWATPGGEVEPGEAYREAARRELHEETGIVVDDVGPQIGERRFVLQLTDGEHVDAEELFFLVRIDDVILSRAGWTEVEMEVMVDHRWWSADDLTATVETIYPESIADILNAALAAS